MQTLSALAFYTVYGTTEQKAPLTFGSKHDMVLE